MKEEKELRRSESRALARPGSASSDSWKVIWAMGYAKSAWLVVGLHFRSASSSKNLDDSPRRHWN